MSTELSPMNINHNPNQRLILDTVVVSHLVLSMIWKPLLVSTMPLTSLTASAKLAFEKDFCICLGVNSFKSPTEKPLFQYISKPRVSSLLTVMLERAAVALLPSDLLKLFFQLSRVPLLRFNHHCMLSDLLQSFLPCPRHWRIQPAWFGISHIFVLDENMPCSHFVRLRNVPRSFPSRNTAELVEVVDFPRVRPIAKAYG